ncbi:hypothetical protein [Flavobacterium panacagri]|uniref:hypothetical protein n=1 Tax=Flavobacterium panacagri TaxID=3034146 RepID=UPI0025A58E53|nr:hypothetical protein [Flavobacterium panacagri]
MPYLWINNKVAVELDELVPKYWNCLKTLQSELNRYKQKPFGIKRLQLGGNGRKLLIDFDSLKIAIQDELGDPRRIDNPLEPFFEFDPQAVRYYTKFKRAGNALEAEEQERYIINASVMSAAIKLEEARFQERIKLRGSIRGMLAILVKDVEQFNITLKIKHEVSHNLPASEKQFKKLLKDCKKDLYYPIIKDPNGGKTNNARKVDDKTEVIFNGLFKNQLHKPTPSEVARHYDAFLNGYAEIFNEETGELLNPKDYKALSNTTIINYINKWENRIATHLSRSGDRQKYMKEYTTPHQMDMPVYSGSIISIDDRNPPFWYEKGKRVWFYIGCDIASQCFTTVVYGKTKEGIITDFYRQMVRNHTEWKLPLPHELECESSLNSNFRNTLLRPGAMFQSTRIIANKASGKYIERMFGKIRYDIEKESYGWISRPHAKKESNQAGPGENKIIPYNQLVNDRMIEIEQWNNMPHPTERSISRFDYFLKKQHPDLKPTNWEAILPIIGYKTETSCRLGYVTLQGRKRAIANEGSILTGEALINILKIIESKEVVVYWLDGNDGQVIKALVYFNERLICEIVEMPRYNRASIERTKADHEARVLQSSYVASVESFARQQRSKFENINITDKRAKTVNSNFKFSNLKRFEAKEEHFPEIFEDQDEDALMLTQTTAIPSWKRNFIQ